MAYIYILTHLHLTTFSQHTLCRCYDHYNHLTAFSELTLPGCIKLSQDKKTLRYCTGKKKLILKQCLRIPVIWRCLMQTSPVGSRKKIAKPLYLIEKTFSLVKNKPWTKRLQGFIGIRSFKSQTNSKFFQQKLTLSRAAGTEANT